MADVHLLTDMALALTVALVGGLVARRLGLPTIVGYLLAGVAIGPFTPGPSADLVAIQEIAELGVIFLMFGIGLSFELKEIRDVGKVAAPGSVLLMALMTAIGFGLGRAYGLASEPALVLGFAISVCSTAALSRTLVTEGLSGSFVGKLAIAWAAVEDLGTVLMLALLPALGEGDFNWWEVLLDMARALGFVAVMLLAGPRIIPPILRRIVALGSRELFILSVVCLALGIASTATLFDVSVALGAFVAGVVLSETEMGHQATADVLPLREAFAVLFFVSVGMLLNPEDVFDTTWLLPAVLVAVIAGRMFGVLAIFALLPFSGHQALLIGASLAQIGEFSFLIVNAALEDGVIDQNIYNVVLAAAAGSLLVNQFLIRGVPFGERVLAGSGPLWRALRWGGPIPDVTETLSDHVIIVGFGRVGELVGHAMDSAGMTFIVVEANLERARRLAQAGRHAVWGDAANDQLLDRAGIQRARLVVLALPDHATTVLAVGHIRRVAPHVPVLVRAHGSEELHLIRQYDVQEVVVPEFEGGLELVHQSLLALGFSDDDAEGYRLAIRDIHYGAAAQHETIM